MYRVTNNKAVQVFRVPFLFPRLACCHRMLSSVSGLTLILLRVKDKVNPKDKPRFYRKPDSSTDFTLSCHNSGNGKKKKGFFKVRERSGNFTQSRRKFLFFREVRENRIFVTNSRKEPSLFLSTREDESLFTNFQ